MPNYNSLMIVRKYNISDKNYFIGELLTRTEDPNVNIIEDRYVLDLENEDIDDLSLITFHLDDIYLLSNNKMKLLDNNIYKEYMKNSPFEFFLNKEFKIHLNNYKILTTKLSGILSISNLKDEEYERYADMEMVEDIKKSVTMINMKNQINIRDYSSSKDDIFNEYMSPLSEEKLDFIKDFARQPKENNVLLYIDKNKPEETEILDCSGKIVYSADNLAMDVFGWDDKEAFENFIKQYSDVITENNKLYCLELFLFNAEYGLEHGDFYVFDENNKIFNYKEYENYNNLKGENNETFR